MTVVHRVPTLTARPRPIRSAVLMLPALCGSRAQARTLIAELPTRSDRILVDCRNLVAGTQTFVDELVRVAATGRKPFKFINLADVEFGGFIDDRRAAHQVEHLIPRVLRKVTA